MDKFQITDRNNTAPSSKAFRDKQNSGHYLSSGEDVFSVF
jgi:hypothetical protein